MVQRCHSQVIIQDKTLQGIFAQFWFTLSHINIAFFSPPKVCVNVSHLTLSPYHPYRIRDNQQVFELNHSHWLGKSFGVGQRRSRKNSLARLVYKERKFGGSRTLPMQKNKLKRESKTEHVWARWVQIKGCIDCHYSSKYKLHFGISYHFTWLSINMNDVSETL